MAKSKITEHADGLVDFGSSVRIERRFKQELQGGFVWDVYERVAVKDGIHPVIGTATTEKHVWTKIGSETSEADARALALKTAGM